MPRGVAYDADMSGWRPQQLTVIEDDCRGTRFYLYDSEGAPIASRCQCHTITFRCPEHPPMMSTRTRK